MRVITMLGAAWLAWASVAAAQSTVTVTTIGGGPLTACGTTAGYNNGATVSESQFSDPYAAAFDSLGNLYIADHKNNAVRVITTPGQSGSVTETYGPLPPFYPRIFTNVMGVATDPNGNIYVLMPGFVARADQYGNVTSTANLSGTETGTAIVVAQDGSDRVFISSTNRSGSGAGTIWLYDLGSTNSVQLFTGGWQPVGLTITSTGRLVASDVARSGIYGMATNGQTGPALIAGGNGAGYVDGPPNLSAFKQPHGVVASSDGHIVVADTGNNFVRLIDNAGNTTTLYGTLTSFWGPNNCAKGEYPGWLDGSPGESSTAAESRQPTGVVLSKNGTLYVTETYYNLIREVTGTGLTAVSSNILSTNNGISVPAPTFSPNSGYFAGCVTVSVTSAVPSVYYTTDGSTPTTNSAAIAMSFVATNGAQGYYVGSFQWCNASSDLSNLRVIAVLGASVSPVTSGQGIELNQIGFAHNIIAGVGSTVVVPVVANLQPNSSLESLQFRIEINPGPGNNNLMAPFNLLPIGSNDYVSLIGPAPGNAAVAWQTFPYPTASGGQGMIVSALGNGSGLSVQNFAVLTLLQVPIPATVSEGQTYTLDVLYPSGTSDGIATDVALTNLPTASLIISNRVYFSGDSSPATGYNAGEFGDGALNNSDVNNVFYASVGIRKPFPFSDAYNAMDVWPESPGVTGDTFINIHDWQTILQRSLGLDTNDWVRFWMDDGTLGNSNITWVPNGAPVKLSVPKPPPGSVWFCQASLGASSQSSQIFGGTCSFPIYVNVLPGYSLSGMQFRAVVNANGLAPQAGAVQFNPAPGIPPPISLPGLSPNDIVRGWQFGAFSPSLQGSNYLGTVTFTIPASAKIGQTYTLQFIGVDGAPNITTAYQMESFSAVAAVGAAAPKSSGTSDEWKTHFFGSVTNVLAADNADADGDGMSNLQEYLAGTDPTNASSKLAMAASGLTVNGVTGVSLSWLTAPGKSYLLETSATPSGGTWTVVGTYAGDGYSRQVSVNNNSGSARFYRIRLQP